jgi:hypothetical protein
MNDVIPARAGAVPALTNVIPAQAGIHAWKREASPEDGERFPISATLAS